MDPQQITFGAGAPPDAWVKQSCREFCSMEHTAYNQLQAGTPEEAIIEQVIPDRHGDGHAYHWRESVLVKAKASITSQQELLRVHVKELEWKMERVKLKQAKTRNLEKMCDYEARIIKLERKKVRLDQHIKNGTLPKVIFGGRRNIGSAEWHRRRSGHLYSVGCAWKGGNLNTRIHKTPAGFGMQIRNWKGETRTLPLHVPDRSEQIFTAIADGRLKPLEPSKSPTAVRPYTVTLVETAIGYRVLVSVPFPTVPLNMWKGERLAAIDLNPDHLDMAIVDKYGNLVASKTFSEPALLHARSDKREWLASNLLEKALNWMHYMRADALAVEKLKFKGREHGRKVNRVLGGFSYRKVISLLTVKALRRELILIMVPAAYSSRIAKTKYKPMFPRKSVHQLAAMILARRALGFNEKLKLDELKQVAGRVHKRQAWVQARFLYGHRHPCLKSEGSADGRIDPRNTKGMESGQERVTPRTRDTSKNPALDSMQRLSHLLPTRWRVGRVEAHRDDCGARAHIKVASPPQPCDVKPKIPAIGTDVSSWLNF